MNSIPERERRWPFLIVVGIALIAGGAARFIHAKNWHETDSQACYSGQPLIATFDGYHYLRYARDLLEHSYTRIDTLRAAPEHGLRPSPPPLLSLVTSGITTVTGMTLAWIAVILPPLLSLLVLFPLYAIGRILGNRFSGGITGLLTVLAPYYLRRTQFGRYDTDCGNVFFVTLAAWLGIKVATSVGKRQCAYVAGFVVNFFLFFLWWDMAPQVTVVICLGSLAVAWLTEPRKARLPPLFFVIATAICALWVSMIKGWRFWLHLPRICYDMLRYVAKAHSDHFPNIGVTISEQSSVGVRTALEMGAGAWVLSAAGFAGLILAFIREPRKAAQLIPLLALGTLGFVFAQRFALFLSPVLALGAGYLAHNLLTSRFTYRVARSVRFATYAVLAWIALSLFSKAMDSRPWPSVPTRIVEGLSRLNYETPQDAVIWTWWDHGHAAMYWARRSTVIDGALHDGELSAVCAFPLTSPDYRQSANWMHFYATRGRKGLRRVYEHARGVSQGLRVLQHVMASGPDKARPWLIENGFVPADEWLSFFFPPLAHRRPIYLFIDERSILTSFWWYWLGTWDVARGTGVHPHLRLFYGISQQSDQLQCSPNNVLNMASGIFHNQTETQTLARLLVRKSKYWQVTNYREGGNIFEFDPSQGCGILCSPDIYDSVFNKLYFLGITQTNYFEPIFRKGLYYQAWRVHGEEVPHPAY